MRARQFTLLCVLVSGGLLSVASAATRERRNDVPLDEVLVQGRRINLDDLRKQVISLEDKFYERYNNINENDDFDIHCIMEAKTGTRFVKRSCRPLYQEEALRAEGKDAFISIQDVLNQIRMGNPNPSVFNSPPVPATVMIEARLPEYKENMKRVVSSDLTLQEIMKERAEKIALYEQAEDLLFRRRSAQDPSDSEKSKPADAKSNGAEVAGGKSK